MALRLILKAIYIKSCLLVFLVFFSPFTSLGEEKAALCAFRAFVCFACVDLCLFPLPLGVRNWLRLVIVALPGLFFLYLLLSILPDPATFFRGD